MESLITLIPVIYAYFKIFATVTRPNLVPRKLQLLQSQLENVNPPNQSIGRGALAYLCSRSANIF